MTLLDCRIFSWLCKIGRYISWFRRRSSTTWLRWSCTSRCTSLILLLVIIYSLASWWIILYLIINIRCTTCSWSRYRSGSWRWRSAGRSWWSSRWCICRLWCSRNYISGIISLLWTLLIICIWINIWINYVCRNYKRLWSYCIFRCVFGTSCCSLI